MPCAIAVVEDLLFASRIKEAARGKNLELRAARRPEQLTAALLDGVTLVLVDADSDRLSWSEAIEAARAAAGPDLAIVAFVSHVHAQRALAARRAGASRVLARSAFVQELDALLSAAAAPPSRTPESSPPPPSPEENSP